MGCAAITRPGRLSGGRSGVEREAGGWICGPASKTFSPRLGDLTSERKSVPRSIVRIARTGVHRQPRLGTVRPQNTAFPLSISGFDPDAAHALPLLLWEGPGFPDRTRRSGPGNPAAEIRRTGGGVQARLARV